MRHLECAELWLQEIFRGGRAVLHKINGKLNPADLYTKYLARPEIIYHMATLGFRLFGAGGEEAGVKDSRLQWEDPPEDDYVEEGMTVLLEQWLKIKGEGKGSKAST